MTLALRGAARAQKNGVVRRLIADIQQVLASIAGLLLSTVTLGTSNSPVFEEDAGDATVGRVLENLTAAARHLREVYAKEP